MDNGQTINEPQNPFTEGITPGVGTSPESINPIASGNLNLGVFENQSTENYNERGDAVLNAVDVAGSTIELTMPPANTSSPQLGQVVDLMTPPQINSPQGPQAADTPNSADNNESLDQTITEHLADGKVDKDDIGFLKSRTAELANDPVRLAEFVMKARLAITNKTSKESK